MTNKEVQERIAELKSLLEVKEQELALRTNRRKELEHKQTANIKAKKQFITRIKNDIKALLDEISSMKTELWGLQEINLPEA